MVDSISKRLDDGAQNRPSRRQYPYEPEPPGMRFRISWLLPVGIGLFVLMMVGLVAVFLLTRGGG